MALFLDIPRNSAEDYPTNLQFDFEDNLSSLSIVAETVQFRLRFESLNGEEKKPELEISKDRKQSWLSVNCVKDLRLH